MSEIVVTAKGARLNMAELRMRARRPMQPQADRKDKIKPQLVPPAQMRRVRGFMPSASGVEKPMVEAVDKPEVESKSVVDYTGIVIDEARHLKQKPENPVATANQTLNEIMTELEQVSPRRRSRKS